MSKRAGSAGHALQQRDGLRRPLLLSEDQREVAIVQLIIGVRRHAALRKRLSARPRSFVTFHASRASSRNGTLDTLGRAAAFSQYSTAFAVL